MMRVQYLIALSVFMNLVVPNTNGHALLFPQATIRIPRAAGAFDHMLIDSERRRLLVAHTSSKALAIVDLGSGRLIRQIYVAGFPHGLVIDRARNRYLVGVSGEPQVIEIDRITLHTSRVLRLPRPVDAIALDTKRERLYADEDNGQHIWVLNRAGRIVATISTPQDSDKIEYDGTSDRLYQNFTTIDSTLVIDPARNGVVVRWSTLPARRPHGLVIDPKLGVLYVGGANGWIASLDRNTGRVVASSRIAMNVDQIALDAQRRRLYCASGDGFISVLDISTRALKLLSNIAVPSGAHTLAVDPASGDVWIAYGSERDDYIMKLGPR